MSWRRRILAWLALLLVVMAIGMKAVVPTGYMVGGASKTLTFQICDGKGSQSTASIAVPVSEIGRAHV